MSRLGDASSLLSVLSQLGIAKGHLFQAGRELLLLFQTLVGVAGDYTEGLKPSKTVLTAKELLTQIRGVTATILDKLPDGDERKAEQMREAIFRSILGVLEVEIGRLSKSSSPKAQLKREALEAIVTTLQRACLARFAVHLGSTESRRESRRAEAKSGQEVGEKKGRVQNAAA